MEHVNPCQSTGVWFSEPTPAALAFLQQYLEWLGTLRNDQWDQAAWNEVSQSLKKAWVPHGNELPGDVQDGRACTFCAYCSRI